MQKSDALVLTQFDTSKNLFISVSEDRKHLELCHIRFGCMGRFFRWLGLAYKKIIVYQKRGAIDSLPPSGFFGLSPDALEKLPLDTLREPQFKQIRYEKLPLAKLNQCLSRMDLDAINALPKEKFQEIDFRQLTFDKIWNLSDAKYGSIPSKQIQDVLLDRRDMQAPIFVRFSINQIRGLDAIRLTRPHLDKLIGCFSAFTAQQLFDCLRHLTVQDLRICSAVELRQLRDQYRGRMTPPQLQNVLLACP